MVLQHTKEEEKRKKKENGKEKCKIGRDWKRQKVQ
jgi:hypothetical protein